MVKLELKVGKELMYLQMEPEDSFEDFQAKVFTLTDIPPKNLKVLFKARMLKDTESLRSLPQGAQLIIMGTRTNKELKKTGQIKIETKMEEEYSTPTRYGFQNIGNTCYMNATMQLLRSIPEFNQSVKNVKLQLNSTERVITKQFQEILKQVEVADVSPKMFVALFLNANPEFQPFGTQQDSDEFMQKLLGFISNSSPQLAKTIHELLSIDLVDTIKNLQLQDEPEQKEYHQTLKMFCSLGGVNKDLKVGTLMESLKMSMEGVIEKLSSKDNANHTYSKITQFAHLPKYLIFQMVRFFLKPAADLPNAKPIPTKICKTIDFSHRIDLFNHCTTELQEKFKAGREALEANKQREEEQYKKKYEEYKQSLGETNCPQTRIIQQFKAKWKREQKPLTQGLQTGIYELTATITHLGQSVDSGHYIAWVKENDEEWTKYDDNTVYLQPSQKILQLRGGQPNLQIAYILLFRKVLARPIDN